MINSVASCKEPGASTKDDSRHVLHLLWLENNLTERAKFPCRAPSHYVDYYAWQFRRCNIANSFTHEEIPGLDEEINVLKPVPAAPKIMLIPATSLSAKVYSTHFGQSLRHVFRYLVLWCYWISKKYLQPLVPRLRQKLHCLH